MKEAIGGTWLFQIVILFVLLFTGYVCLTINYSRAFDVKDKIINEIERNGGFKTTKDDYTLNEIKKYMAKVGYRATGPCSGFDIGCDRDGSCANVTSNKEYAYCIKEVKFDSELSKIEDAHARSNKLYGKHVTDGEFYYLSYYKVRVFYSLDLPVIREFFDFKINGDTKTLYRVSNMKDVKK